MIVPVAFSKIGDDFVGIAGIMEKIIIEVEVEVVFFEEAFHEFVGINVFGETEVRDDTVVTNFVIAELIKGAFDFLLEWVGWDDAMGIDASTEEGEALDNRADAEFFRVENEACLVF